MEGASKRFEHGMGLMDFDGTDGGVVEDTDNDGFRGGELDSFPISFGAE